MRGLWFAFKLVSLNHWKQLIIRTKNTLSVVICFQISIFEPLETAVLFLSMAPERLWFAFKLVSLNHWKQPVNFNSIILGVVICFQISIFEPLETAEYRLLSIFQRITKEIRKIKIMLFRPKSRNVFGILVFYIFTSIIYNFLKKVVSFYF